MSHITKTEECRGGNISNHMEAHWQQLSDKELIDLLVSGNREVFAVLCQKYERRLFNTAFRITKNVTDAEGAVQEALFKAYRKIDTFQFASSLSTWLTQIVINCSLMELRRRRPRRALSLDEVIEDGVPLLEVIPDPHYNVEETVSLNEQLNLLAQRIARLPPQLRTIIETHYISEPTMAELAEAHAITVPAVKSRLMRARALVKKPMQCHEFAAASSLKNGRR